MWPLPQIKDEYIQVILHQSSIAISWIQPAYSHIAQLKTYEVYQIPMIDQTMVYNKAALRNIIRTFADNHDLNHAYISFVIGKDLINEQIIKHQKSNPTINELIGKKDKHKQYYDRYLGPYEDQYLFYVCSATHPLILQLQMLNLQLPLHVRHISPPMSIQITLYKQLYQHNFNQARLAQAINIESISIPSIFSLELLRRCLKTYRPFTHKDRSILYALGSFIGAQT